MQIGIIYRIFHNDSDIQYVGSTMKSLYERWVNHVNKHQQGNCSIHNHMREFGIENFQIVELKKYNVVDKKHLRVYEQLWINKLKCVNKHASFNPLRADKKRYGKLHYEFNREAITVQMKQYQAANKEAIAMRQKHYREANHESIQTKKKQYRETNKEAVALYKKQYREANRDAIRAKESVKHDCICGISATHTNLARHIKTAKHINYMNATFEQD